MLAVAVLCSALSSQADPYEIVTSASQARAEAITSLVAELGGDRKKGQHAAIRLVRFGRHAVPALAEALKSENAQKRLYGALRKSRG